MHVAARRAGRRLAHDHLGPARAAAGGRPFPRGVLLPGPDGGQRDPSAERAERHGHLRHRRWRAGRGQGGRDPARGGLRRAASSSSAGGPELPVRAAAAVQGLPARQRRPREGPRARAGLVRGERRRAADRRTRAVGAGRRRPTGWSWTRGRRSAYDKLLLATGSSPRRLSVPGADLDGVRYLRTLRRLRPAARRPPRRRPRLVVVGAGWIGLEVAAAARTLRQRRDRRGAPAHPAARRARARRWARSSPRLHREHGVDLRTGTGVREFRGDGAASRRWSPTAATRCPPTSWWSASARRRTPSWPRRPGSRSTTASSPTRRCGPRRPTCSPPATSRTRSTRSSAGTSASSTGPTRSTAGRRRRGRCSARTSATTGCPTSSPTSTTWAWSTPGSAARRTPSSAAATPTDGEFIAFWLSGGRVVAGMNVNVWDVTDPIQALIRSGREVPAERLARSRRPAGGTRRLTPRRHAGGRDTGP